MSNLLEDRTGIKTRTPMPMQDVTNSTKVLAVTGETVTFSNGVAGTTQRIKLTYDAVMSQYEERIGQDGDTSISWTTGTVLTTEIPWRWKNVEGKDNETERLTVMANGEYMVDYENGYILGKNAITTSSATDTIAYKVRTGLAAISGSVTVGDIVLASSDTGDSYSVDQSAAIESSSVSKASSGNVFKAAGRITSTVPTAEYYFQLLNSTTVPANGAVTFLMTPIKIDHTFGEDTFWDIDLTPAGLPATTGISWCISTTEFTKTEATANASVTILYK